jgi:hypothetical protein
VPPKKINKKVISIHSDREKKEQVPVMGNLKISQKDQSEIKYVL